MEMIYSLGIDFGTSGARAIAISQNSEISQTVVIDNIQQTPDCWRQVLFELLASLRLDIRQNLQAITINGTSGTVLLCDQIGQPLTAALLYNDNRGKDILNRLKTFAPSDHLVNSASSSLAKLLWFEAQGLTENAQYFLHQADWLSFLLHGKLGISDYHNALKLGYDVAQLTYPDWLKNHPLAMLLPQVKAPSEKVGKTLPELAKKFSINPHCDICAGTTDSIAAFLASGASQVGEAVTSLGSTLVLKLLSEQPINDLNSGVYSHRLGDFWLIGGASNTGGAVLKHYFDAATLEQLSTKINPEIDSDLNYYPLLKVGDRFPINDPNLEPQLMPRPVEDAQFLQGLLEGIARIESIGYAKLTELGASKLQRVYTAGGGANNAVWKSIRQRYLGCPVLISPNPQAAYGSALLARQGLFSFTVVGQDSFLG